MKKLRFFYRMKDVMKEKVAKNINILASFCGKRDLPELTQKALEDKYSLKQADVMVLFGGSILVGGDSDRGQNSF